MKATSPETPLQLWTHERNGKVFFVFWTAGEWKWRNKEWRNNGKEGWRVEFARPSDDCRTRPIVIEWTGKELRNLVWVDLLTGRIFDYPAHKILKRAGGQTLIDVPAYDSPCVLIDRNEIN